MNPGRGRTLVRVLQVMRLVEGRDRCNLDSLADQFRVHPRTIRRDLQALAAAGVRVPHRGAAYASRCVHCDGEFRTRDPFADLCPRCKAREDAEYLNDPTPYAEPPLRLYSKPAMRERLGVSGDVDE